MSLEYQMEIVTDHKNLEYFFLKKENCPEGKFDQYLFWIAI